MAFFQRIGSRLLFPISFLLVKFRMFRHYEEYLLSTWYYPEKRKWMDSVLFDSFFNVWIKYEYLSETNPDRREALKHMAMGSESGRLWAQSYDHHPLNFNSTIGDITFNEAMPLFSETEKTLQDSTDVVVIQIGSSSGREIAYFASKFPDIQFIGTDIYPEVIDYSTENHKEKNLEFQIIAAKDIATLLGKLSGKNIVVISSGSLQYVQPEHLEIFFHAVRQFNAEIFINEPGYFDKISPDELQGSRYRDNFSFTHNYRYYAEKAGLMTCSSKIIRVYLSMNPSSLQYKTIHYFYHGKSRNN